MTEVKGGDVNVTLENLLQMVKQIGKNQEKHKQDLEKQIDGVEDRLSKRIDKLQHQVVGNGDERAIISRLRDIENSLDNLTTQQAKNTQCIQELSDFQDAWRNRIIGIAIAFPIITALLVIVISHVLGIALAP